MKHLTYLFLLAALVFPTFASAAPATVTMTWNDNSNNEDGFIVERKIPPAAYVELLRTPMNVATATDTVNSGVTACYHVLAFNAGGKSVPSNEVCIGIPVLPVPPNGFSVTVTLGVAVTGPTPPTQ